MNMKLFSFVYTDTTQFTRFLTQAHGRVEVRSSLEFKTGTWPVILYTKKLLVFTTERSEALEQMGAKRSDVLVSKIIVWRAECFAKSCSYQQD